MRTFWQATAQVVSSAGEFWRGRFSGRPFNLLEVAIGLALVSFARALTDVVFWFKEVSPALLTVTFILWTIYLTALYVATAFLITAVTRQVNFKQALTAAINVYWVIPLIPVFSLLPWEGAWGLGVVATVPLFRWIPTFTVYRNYLPLGMVVVVPFIVAQTARFFKSVLSISWPRAWWLTLLVYTPVYVYFYQWAKEVMMIATFDRGYAGVDKLWAAYSANAYTSEAITLLLSPIFARAYTQLPRWVYIAYSASLLLAVVFLPRWGLVAAFLMPSLR